MAIEELSKELVQKLMKIPGEARGMHFKNDAQYVLTKFGEEGLKKVEEELERMGCPMSYKGIRPLDFYPVGLRPISLLAIKRALNLRDENIRDLCGYATSVSLIVRLYLKFFYSLPKIIEKASKIWGEYFTVGEIRVVEYDEKKKFAIIETKGLDLHPVFCGPCLEGYLENLVKMIVKSEEVTCQETKCPFKGDKFHEYLIKWQ